MLIFEKHSENILWLTSRSHTIRPLCVVFFLVFFMEVEGILAAEPAVERQRLRSDLLRSYDRDRRPVADQIKDAVNVSVFFQVQHIVGLDERNQILSVNGMLALAWTDKFLTWDPNSYSGISAIRFSPEQIWHPDIQAVNKPLIQSEEVRGTEWSLKNVGHTIKSAESGRSYNMVNVTMHLERISRMYRYVCVVPTLVSMFTILFGFWLLPNENSRYVIGCTNIIVLSMLLQHLAATVPAGKVVPLIAQYSASCLCLSTIFIIVTVISNLLRESKGTAPSVLLRLAHFSLDRYLCIFTFSHVSGIERIKEPTSTESTGPTLDEIKRRKDWLAVSVLVDRVVFCCFVFVFVVLLAILAAI